MRRMLILAVVFLAGKAEAAEISFNREIRPILAEHCFQCHGADSKDRRGGLRLDLRDAAMQGGESKEPALVPGQPEKSQLLARIHSNDADVVMPPPSTKKSLSLAQKELLKQWIAAGAPYSKHWSFEPPKKEPVPNGDSLIDHFVARRLGVAGLKSAPPAEAAILCRRIHLDLIGLPPTLAELAAFEKAHGENSTKAVRELIDRLLQSPRFGEKWARQWLDVARYSDSNGYEKDLPREQWAWRDWVIAAYNRDLPYDQFLIEQLAGDFLPNATQDQLVATGFLRNSMINEEGAIVPEQFRMDEMFDRMDCIGKSILGLSLQCAQCHSHKFDPITQDDYYGLFAFFNNTYEAQSWVYTAEQRQQIDSLRKQIRTLEDTLKKQRPAWETELAEWQKSVLDREIEWTPLRANELESTSGLNHSTQQADFAILTQGHPTTKGDIYGIFDGDFLNVTGLRLEALTHGDMPFNGPGRSKYGTWAISEMKALSRGPGSDQWVPIKLVQATADFSEPEGRLEEEWKADYDKDGKRTRGPVAFLIDGNEQTGWRADRGPGLRNQAGVAVVQFEKPLELPPGSELKVMLVFDHGGSDNGRHNVQLGCCRISTTKTANPVAQPIDYEAILALKIPPDQRTAEQKSAIFTAWRKSLTDANSKKVNDGIAAEWKKYPSAKTSVLHLAEREPRHFRPTKLLDRGGWDRPRHEVPANVINALYSPTANSGPAKVTNRLDAARWLASANSPLTARVAVNRVWQSLFGQGLAETPEDFGSRSTVPQYQDVLDGLAVDFMEHGWSHKHLLRTILTSRTYQQSATGTASSREQDPTNRWLSRGPRFRLDAEVIRDGALSIAGLLSVQELGGPSLFPPVPQSVLDYNYFKPTYWTPPQGPERYRRALYVFRKRSMPDPVMSGFDAPNGDFACAARPRSNTPLSALTSLNEAIFVEAAQAFAQRILKEGGPDDASRIGFAWRLCTARTVQPTERNRVLKLLDEQRQRLRRGELKASEIAFNALSKVESLPADATPNDIAAWTIVSRVLLNLDETLTKP